MLIDAIYGAARTNDMGRDNSAKAAHRHGMGKISIRAESGQRNIGW